MTERRRQKTTPAASRRPRARVRRAADGAAGRGGGFTLTELLVVIGVIVLMIGMAVALFNIFSGNRSIEGGQNIVSAMLQRARARALAMQERRGVLVFEDQVTHKTGMLLVKIDEPLVGDPTNTYILELDDQDEEMQLLPTGVGAAFVLGAAPQGGTAGTANTTATTYRPYGLIAFDGVGRIVTLGNFTVGTGSDPALAVRYPANATTGKPAGQTNLSFYYGKNIYPGTASSSQVIGKAVPGSVPQEYSHSGLLLFDKNVYAEVQVDPSGDWRKLSAQQSQWLDQNGTALVVNRYNGTLIRGE